MSLVAGVDVGGARKGFHAVALLHGSYHGKFSSPSPREIANWCRAMGASHIGIDAPCCWSTDGHARLAEREMMRKEIWCFSTPSEDKALCHPTGHFGWMINGMALYQAFRSTHPLYSGSPAPQGQLCFETFPQAIACALSNCIVLAKKKSTVRRKILVEYGLDTSTLANIDEVDAALCALTAHYFAQSRIQTYGDATTGHIVVPDSTTSKIF